MLQMTVLVSVPLSCIYDHSLWQKLCRSVLLNNYKLFYLKQNIAVRNKYYKTDAGIITTLILRKAVLDCTLTHYIC